MHKLLALAILLTLSGSVAAEPAARKTPYWASISAGEALMRTGPGRNYPATWLYKRPDLPIKVVEIYPSWRKVRDPDGATGWMLVNLLSDTRTAIVTGNEPRPLRKAPSPDADAVYMVQPGVVGRIAKCDADWCRFDVGGRIGFIDTAHIWGLDKGEMLR